MYCTFINNTLTATGFQMMAQLLSSSGMQKLYTDQTANRQIPASVVVEKSGIYQITVLAITAESGVVDSVVEYTESVEVNIPPDIPITTVDRFTAPYVHQDGISGTYV